MHGETVATELALAERILAGDRTAEEELVARFYRRVLVLARVRLRDEQKARDIAQEVMLQVLMGVRAGRLNHHEKLAPYILGTTRNLINNTFRERRGVGSHSADEAGSCLDPHQLAELHERLDLVRTAVGRFDPVDREILALTLIEGMKPGEIAWRMGMKPERVRKRKSRAVEKLRILMQSRSRR